VKLVETRTIVHLDFQPRGLYLDTVSIGFLNVISYLIQLFLFLRGRRDSQSEIRIYSLITEWIEPNYRLIIEDKALTEIYHTLTNDLST
jgi:hypothetical protein